MSRGSVLVRLKTNIPNEFRQRIFCRSGSGAQFETDSRIESVEIRCDRQRFVGCVVAATDVLSRQAKTLLRQCADAAGILCIGEIINCSPVSRCAVNSRSSHLDWEPPYDSAGCLRESPGGLRHNGIDRRSRRNDFPSQPCDTAGPQAVAR